ncbi:MAG: TraB/GumN family protein [Promethearchaeota archaeon]
MHGQIACIDEARRVIEELRPEVVAIELPPTFKDTGMKDLDERIRVISESYHEFFTALEALGLPKHHSGGIEKIALGLSLQGVEFLAAIEAARKVKARVEFIDVARDKIFWEFARKILENLFPPPLMGGGSGGGGSHGGDKVEIFPGVSISRMELFSLDEVSNFIKFAVDDWRELWNQMVRIYSADNYETLLDDILPLMRKMQESPAFKEVVVEYRNRFMARKLVKLLSETTGKIVLITGFGHVDGIKELISKTTAGN